MRKIVLFVAALLFMAVPVMAAVSNVDITCDKTVVGDVNWVTVSYASDQNLIRAFGLDIALDVNDGNITELVVLDPCGTKYRIFPGQISIVEGDVNDYYQCYDPCDLGDANLAVEMGSLYTFDTNYISDGNAGYGMRPGLSGDLLKFAYVDAGGFSVDVNVRRGGVVMEDPYEIPVVDITDCQQEEPPPCIVPNVVGMTQAAAEAAIVAAGLVVGTVTDVNGDSTPIGNVTAQNPTNGGNVVDCGTAVDISVAAYCMKSPTTPVSIYNDWVTWNRPKCWCYARNCRGDADGNKLGVYWVAAADLNLLKQTYLKLAPVVQGVPNGICADFDHLPLGVYRVAAADLNTLKQYYLKIEAQVPVCSMSPNYNFWCTPTSTTLGCP